MGIGYFVSDYAQKTDTLERLSSDGMGLLLVANGIYHATIKEEGKASAVLDKAGDIYVLSEDLQARGIDASSVDERAKVVDYAGLVDVVFEKFEKVVWI